MLFAACEKGESARGVVFVMCWPRPSSMPARSAHNDDDNVRSPASQATSNKKPIMPTSRSAVDNPLTFASCPFLSTSAPLTLHASSLWVSARPLGVRRPRPHACPCAQSFGARDRPAHPCALLQIIDPAAVFLTVRPFIHSRPRIKKTPF